jgi:hypothetical protein
VLASLENRIISGLSVSAIKNTNINSVDCILLALTLYSDTAFGYIVDLKAISVNVTKQYCYEEEYYREHNETSPTFAEFNKDNPIIPKLTIRNLLS